MPPPFPDGPLFVTGGVQFPHTAKRILVAGASGAGKTTLAKRLGQLLGLPYVEIDALFHGPDWIPRPTFTDDILAFTAGPEWITEWQYSGVRDVLADRADVIVFLDYPRRLVMTRVVLRTLRRSLRKEILWNGNREPALRTVFTDQDHIIRWAWRGHRKIPRLLAEAVERRPQLIVVAVTSPKEAERLLSTLQNTENAPE